MKLNYVPLAIMVKGRLITQFDFEKVKDITTLEQMLINAVYNMKHHIDSGHISQARAFAEKTRPGFAHAQKVLGKNYDATRLPSLYQQLDQMQRKYVDVIQVI